ncbi:septal ring lytic transglycosylase RlpA family protein [Acuticoccus sp. M5D2P5]|uniref:septal ring lytic transglycosylase RlpA family protein n=1 Tax=Acuticoccus kalidii TaxID=2910977 RepID=UPI001F32FD43|nr:septal ring lytic transglycosylase RlpA family protein [Acuticoccus kalidii]MCF3932997.1 septal ring lytic transglycosylase RlpA family protein [Acuticoccus kalidii]
MTFFAKAALCAAVFAIALPTVTIAIPTEAHAATSSGTASYYGKRFHGRMTANGERFNMNAMTAAHKSLPFGTKVKVTNTKNGRSVVVRINDRGPFVGRRVIDLSRGAAAALDMVNDGLAKVTMEIM